MSAQPQRYAQWRAKDGTVHTICITHGGNTSDYGCSCGWFWYGDTVLGAERAYYHTTPGPAVIAARRSAS